VCAAIKSKCHIRTRGFWKGRRLACGRFFGNLAIAASLFQIAEKGLPALRQQLKAAEKAADNPAIV
jgi:hypothetical protein